MATAIAFLKTEVGTNGLNLIELGLSPGIFNNARGQLEVLFTAETTGVRWICAPDVVADSETGHPVDTHNTQSIVGEANLRNLTIAATSGTSILQITIFRG